MNDDRKEALIGALVIFIGRMAEYEWADQYKPLSVASAEKYFWYLRLTRMFVEGELQALHFRGKLDPIFVERPALEIRRVQGLDHVYVVVNPTYKYAILAEDTHSLQIEVSTALQAPLFLVTSNLPVGMLLLLEKPDHVTDPTAPATWYQIGEYTYLCVFPGSEPLRERIWAFGDWGPRAGGQAPESVSPMTVMPSDMDRWAAMITDFEAGATTRLG